MIRHHLLLFFRTIKKNKITFFINLVGLATGLTTVLIIFFWVQDELKKDAFHNNNIHVVMSSLELDNKIITNEGTPLLLSEALMNEFPEVKVATSLNNDFATPKGILSADNYAQEATGLIADKNFFNVFSFSLVYGDVESALKGKRSVVLTERLAKKLFKNPELAIGKSMEWDYEWDDSFEETSVVITGIVENPTEDSTIQFDAIFSTDVLVEADRWAGHWSGHYAKTYLVLNKKTNPENFNKKIAKFLSTKLENRNIFTLFTQPFSERYLKNPYENGKQVGGRIVYVRLFSIIAIIILIIACINFINLSTAQSSKRIKEIGVRKALGNQRKSLIFQFISESVLTVVLALILAIGLLISVLPYFNSLTAKNIHLDNDWNIIVSILFITLLTGLLSGSYPAFYLSKFKPVNALKGILHYDPKEQKIRKGLVVLQFAISVIFIVSVPVIAQQLQFMIDKNIGYEKSDIITFQIKNNNKRPDAFINELKKVPGVETVSNMNGSILDGDDHQGGFDWRENPDDKKILFHSPRIGYGVTETLGMEILQGRSFSKKFADNDSKILINEAALHLMQLKNPVGTKVMQAGQEREIIGVVKDFQYGSLHKKIEPLIFRFRDFGTTILLKTSYKNTATTLDEIKKVYTAFQPVYDFEYTFLKSDYEKLYASETKIAALSKWFAALAIIISCLGLLGLAVFTSENRRKEISIRKVLGQSGIKITQMLSKEFLKLILIAAIIALPLAYFLMNYWLSKFAYKIPLHLGYFAFALSLTLIITLITVGFQALYAVQKKPVEVLREE